MTSWHIYFYYFTKVFSRLISHTKTSFSIPAEKVWSLTASQIQRNTKTKNYFVESKRVLEVLQNNALEHKIEDFSCLNIFLYCWFFAKLNYSYIKGFLYWKLTLCYAQVAFLLNIYSYWNVSSYKIYLIFLPESDPS